MKHLVWLLASLIATAAPLANDINRLNASGETPLIRAAETGNKSTAQQLLKQGADVNLVDPEGNTALFYAISNGYEDVAMVLVQAGTDLNLKYTNQKENILFECGRMGQLQVIRLIMQQRPDLARERNAAGKTPADEAELAAQSKAAELLKN